MKTTSGAGSKVRLSPGGDRLFVGSVAKSFQILELLCASGRGLTLMELAERSGLGKSACQRAAHTLRVLGYLSQHPDSRAYSLSYRMLELTHTVLAEDRVRMASLPHLEALSHACGETVNLTRLAGTEVVFIARFPSRHSVSVDLHIGSRLPAYCTAPGRAILSRLPDDEAKRLIAASDRKALTPNTVTDPRRLWSLLLEARKRGFALNNQESQIGDVAIGAPLLDRGGQGRRSNQYRRSFAPAVDLPAAAAPWCRSDADCGGDLPRPRIHLARYCNAVSGIAARASSPSMIRLDNHPPQCAHESSTPTSSTACPRRRSRMPPSSSRTSGSPRSPRLERPLG